MISLCMIVKNEETCIDAALHSVRDLVSEMIVVDTGSTDRTPQIARELGARVFQFTWCDDFSAARNFSLSHAREKWILCFDADEIIDQFDIPKIRSLCTEESHLAGYFLTQRNYTNDHRRQNFVFCQGTYPDRETARGYVPVERITLFRNIPDIRFTGVIHETVGSSIARAKGVVGRTDCVIHHYGYLNQGEKNTKYEYYLQLGLKQIEYTPLDAKPYYDVGVIYANRGDFINAERYFLKAISLNEDYEDVLLSLALIYFRWHKFDQALAYLDRAYAKGKKHEQITFTRGLIFEYLNQFETARQIFEQGIRQYPHNRGFQENLASVLLKSGNYREAQGVFDTLRTGDSMNPDYVLGAIQCRCEMGDISGALDLFLAWETSGRFDEKISVWGLKIAALAGKWKKVEEIISQLEHAGSSAGEVHFYRGMLYHKRGKIRDAVACYKESLAKSPYLAGEVNLRIKEISALL